MRVVDVAQRADKFNKRFSGRRGNKEACRAPGFDADDGVHWDEFGDIFLAADVFEVTLQDKVHTIINERRAGNMPARLISKATDCDVTRCGTKNCL